MTGDPYTLDVRLCDDAGMVSHERTPPNPFAPELTYLGQLNNLRARSGHPPYEGEPFVCTGSAHLAGEHVRCTSSAHARTDWTDVTRALVAPPVGQDGRPLLFSRPTSTTTWTIAA